MRERERGKERVRSQGGAGNLIMANVRLSGAHLVCLPAGHKEREGERGICTQGCSREGEGATQFAVGSADLRAM